MPITADRPPEVVCEREVRRASEVRFHVFVQHYFSLPAYERDQAVRRLVEADQGTTAATT